MRSCRYQAILNPKESASWGDLTELPDNMYFKFFIKSQQAYFNDLLKVRGHVFLNEVLDNFGLKRTGLGAVSGWTKGPIVIGCAYLKKEQSYRLIFNCEGPIISKL